MIERSTRTISKGVGAALPHDSARKHVTGAAVYTDDLRHPEGLLFAAIGTSERAHARIVSLDVAPSVDAPGVVSVMTARDLPAANDISPVTEGDLVFAEGIVQYAGQPIYAVAADTIEHARRAARGADIQYEDLEPVLTIEQALAAGSFVAPSHVMQRGDSSAALKSSPHRLQGTLRTGGQDHFYLEGQVAMAIPGEDGDMLVRCSTQHPTEMQHAVARVLGLSHNAVTIEVRRMGGAFGGKETQSTQFGCIAALLADRTGRPVLLRLDRDDDMVITGKRHDFRIDYDVGFDDSGRIHGIELTLAARCGMSADLSGAVNDRAMFHCDNCYYLDAVTITSHRCKTNTVSNTAFRGFGAPQGMMGIEHAIDEIARYLDRDPLDVRTTNFYGIGDRDVTPYGMTVEDNIINDIVSALEESADYRARRDAVRAFNAGHEFLKKGVALTPVKFGISFTLPHLNQAGALLHVYTDGSVHLNHGGTEMGQGLFIKVAQIVAEEFQIDVDRIKITATDTGKVPNTSATAASAGTDLNGQAALAAARTIKERLIAFAAKEFDVDRAAIVFRDNEVHVKDRTFSFAEVAARAQHARVSLSATGYYRTPKIHYDREKSRGRPFFYFAYGAAVSEVLVDTLTGEYRVTRVDILHDAGKSINPAIDRGQIEGGFVQGMGWLTTEELYWDAEGRLRTHAPSTYKIPVCSDVPSDFRVTLLESARNREDVIHRSKAVGEPPLMLAISVFHALKDAVASVGDYRQPVHLDAPATPERMLLAMEALRPSGNEAAARSKPTAAAGPPGGR